MNPRMTRLGDGLGAFHQDLGKDTECHRPGIDRIYDVSESRPSVRITAVVA